MIPGEDVQRSTAHIVESLKDHEESLSCSVDNDKYQEIVIYNKLISYIESDTTISLCKFNRIAAHEGPLTSSYSSWKRFKYNMMLEWTNREVTNEPLSIIAADSLVKCSIYARDKSSWY